MGTTMKGVAKKVGKAASMLKALDKKAGKSGKGATVTTGSTDKEGKLSKSGGREEGETVEGSGDDGPDGVRRRSGSRGEVDENGQPLGGVDADGRPLSLDGPDDDPTRQARGSGSRRSADGTLMEGFDGEFDGEFVGDGDGALGRSSRSSRARSGEDGGYDDHDDDDEL